MMHLTVRELTERKQTEEELDDSKRYLQALFDNSLDAILVTNDEGRYIDANPAACALLGYTHEELVQLSILDLTPEPFRQEGWAMWQEFLASGSKSGEYSTRRKDGTVIELEFRAVANILPGVHLSSSRDITERKRAEEAQREAEQKYRDIFENAAEGIFQTTPDGRFISANPALVKMLGFSSAEELIRQRADISNEHYVDPKRRDEFKRRMDEQGVVKGFELQAYRKDGSVIWLSENVRTVRDETGKVLYYEGTAWNITERQQANQSLRLFRNLIDRSSDAIEVIDPDTLHFLDCNKSAHQDLGYSREEFLSLRVYDIDTLIDERMAARLAEEMERSGFVIFESIHRRKDGSTFPVEINLKIIRLERDYRLAVVRDITERKVAEEALRNAERKYRDIFENAVEGIFQIRPDSGYISANPALARMLGFNSPEELIQERSDPLRRRFVDPQRREEYIRLLSEEGVVRDFEYEDYRKDGSSIWFSDNVHAVRDSEGTLLYYEGTTQDITERKQVERAQRESQRQYESLVQSIDGIVWEADPRTFMFTFVSKQAERILGYPLERWYEGPNFWPDHMHPEDRDWAVAYCVDAIAKRVGHQFEYRMIAADGRVVWLSDIVTVDVADDESVLLRGLMVDITERKHIEEKLRQSESQLAEAQRLASVGSWNWDLRNNTQTWSDELYHICGLHPQESDPSYETFIKLVHPGDRAAISGAVQRALETQEPINSYLRIIRPDGAERIIHSRGNTIADSSGTPNRMHGTVQDVTERNQAEDALREAERKYREIFENAGEGIFQSTPEGRFIAANPALARMLGFASPEELIHSRPDIPRQLYVDPTRREEFKRKLQEQDAVRGFEHQVFRKDGSKIWISVNARAVRGDHGAIQYYEGTAQDITDRKRAEEALRESEERYRDLVENSRELICTHDLDGLVLSANRAVMEVMGYGSGNYGGGINLREILAPEVRDQFEDYLKRIHADGVASGLMLVQTRSGEKRIWEYHNTLRTQGVSTPIVRGMARDITEQRRASHSLRLFRNLIDQSSEAIEVVDPKTLRFLDCNKSAHQDLGYSREEFLSLTAYDIDPLVHESRTARLIEEMDRSGFVMFESIHRRKDGSTFPVEVNLKMVRHERDYMLAVVRDITERKVAEEALGLAEQKYRDIFENAGEGVFQLTPEGKYIAANPALARMYGFASPEELIHSRQDISQQLYVDPGRRDEFKHQLEEQSSVRGFELQVFRKDGSKIWTSVNARAVRDRQGEIQYYEGTAQDITDRKRAEEALQESEERYRELFENAKDAIYVQDLTGRYISVNRAAEKLSGYDRNEIIGKHFDQVVAPEYLPLVCEKLSKKLADGGQTAYEIEIIARDGQRVPVELSSAVIFNHGVAVGIQGIARDITERRRAENALRDSEARTRAILESAMDCIITMDHEGLVVDWNPAAEKVFGYTRAEAIGRDMAELIIPPRFREGHRRGLAGYLATGESRKLGKRLELSGARADGTEFPIELTITRIELEGNPMFTGYLRDITERKHAEETLRGYSRRLIEAQEAERQHIARELHDQIGQVLTAVRINLETIGNSCGTAESRSLIDQGVVILDAALEQVRNLSFELRPSLLDDLGLVAALRWYSDQYTQRTGIRTRSVTNLPERQSRLRQDLETACFRIVQEALTNVVRHAKARNVLIDLNKGDHSIVLSIKDDGIGFDELRPNVAASAIRLGLRGMKERTLALGGTLKIESVPSQGTEIRASFPTSSNEDETL